MKKLIISFLILAVLLTGCAKSVCDSDQASRVLVSFFDYLSSGDYTAAAALYGGNYETLQSVNPDIDPNDYASLWNNGCQVNGFKCLPIRTINFRGVTMAGDYLFAVEFDNPDNTLFVRGPCCGENSSSPLISQFEFRLEEVSDGQYRVLDMPVYVP